MAALADTLTVARAIGADPEVVWEVLAGGALRGAVDRARSTGVNFAISLAGKDIDLALAELGRAPAPLARAAALVLRAADDQTADIATIATQGSRAPDAAVPARDG